MAKIYNIKDFVNDQRYMFITESNAIVGIVKESFFIENVPWLLLDEAVIGKTKDLQHLQAEFQTNQLYLSLGKVVAMVPCSISKP